MKVLLVNPPRDHSIASEVPTTVNAEVNTMPPLGLMYLEAWLFAHSDHEVRILDCLAEGWDLARLEVEVRRQIPDLVGLTGHTHDLVDMLAVSRMVKRVSPEIRVWWGGPHVSDFPSQSTASPTRASRPSPRSWTAWRTAASPIRSPGSSSAPAGAR